MPSGRSRFATTHWSLVLAAREPSPEAADALEELCARYWSPLHAYLRKQLNDPERAQDYTQAFFAQLLEKRYLDAVRPERGRFRSFLLASIKHFYLNQIESEHAIKRGGHAVMVPLDPLDHQWLREPSDDLTPERLFERRWAVTLLNRSLARVRAEHERAGKADLFELLLPHLTGGLAARPYSELAATAQMSEGAIRVAIHRLRTRVGSALRAEIATTVDGPAAVDDELRYLASVLQGCSL